MLYVGGGAVADPRGGGGGRGACAPLKLKFKFWRVRLIQLNITIMP